jgi:hypothetical protein
MCALEQHLSFQYRYLQTTHVKKFLTAIRRGCDERPKIIATKSARPPMMLPDIIPSRPSVESPEDSVDARLAPVAAAVPVADDVVGLPKLPPLVEPGATQSFQ